MMWDQSVAADTYWLERDLKDMAREIEETDDDIDWKSLCSTVPDEERRNLTAAGYDHEHGDLAAIVHPHEIPMGGGA